MIYTNNTFKGFYPVGSAAVVSAGSPEEAASILENQLRHKGLPQRVSPDSMKKFNNTPGNCVILNDGEY